MAFLPAIVGAVVGAGANKLFSGGSKPSTGPLDKQVAKQYETNMPRVNEELWGMYGQDPAYERGQYLDQLANLRRMGDTTGMNLMRQFGGQAGNLGLGNMFQGLNINMLQAIAQAMQQYQGNRDARKQGILGQIAGNVGQNVGPALSAQMQRSAMGQQSLAGLGSAAGGLMQAYMMSKLQYPSFNSYQYNTPYDLGGGWTGTYAQGPTLPANYTPLPPTF